MSNTGEVPKEVSADAGCYPAQAVDGLYALGTDPPVAPEQTRHGGGAICAPGPDTHQPVGRGPDEAEVADETGPAALRVAHGDGIRPDYRSPRFPAVPAAGLG